MLAAAMLVFLVRHAHSEPGEPDELRPLSSRGREEALGLAERLAEHPTPPLHVISSPLLRARETAEAIADATSAALRVDERLAPGATSETVRELARETEGAGRGRLSPARLLRDRARAHGRRPGVPSSRCRRDHRRGLMPDAIVVRDLRKSYDGVEALRGVSFEVGEGEVFGLLGPNGAGKTTTVEILEGYRDRDGGEVTVLGEDPAAAPLALKERIGVVLQHSEFHPLLSVREVHQMFAGYYAEPRSVDDVIDLVGLAGKRDARVKTLSGGQKRRLDLGIALVGDPDLVFLDEPTTGFDPAARRSAWEMIRAFRSLGKTILLTTHYLDEAQQLADRVAVIQAGEIVSIGTPAELIGDSQSVEVRFVRDGEPVAIATDDPTRTLYELTSEALASGRPLEQLEVRRPTLEDVYLELVADEERNAE